MARDAPLRPDDSVPQPRQKRLVTSDATFEKLHQIMAENPAGIACWRDELAGWLESLERQGRESERQFYLEGWSGHWGATVDRIGRGSVHMEHCCLQVFGGIQPARLRGYLADVLSGGPSDDGLIQRFSLLVWPDFGGQWRYVDRLPSTAAQQRAADVYTRLVQLDADDPLRLRFAPDAQALFIDWLTMLETKIRSADTAPVLRGHLAKYRKLMPVLALLFALADGYTDAVPLESAKRAAGWCEYLEPHACRVYASKLAPEIAAAQTLSRKLSAGWRLAEGLFALRDVYRPQWTGLTSPDEARAALQVLCDYSWVRKEQIASDGPGRPSEIYRINPKIMEAE
jgi:putative DNA primase/helicase